jgi:hypothetical protein
MAEVTAGRFAAVAVWWQQTNAAIGDLSEAGGDPYRLQALLDARAHLWRELAAIADAEGEAGRPAVPSLYAVACHYAAILDQEAAAAVRFEYRIPTLFPRSEARQAAPAGLRSLRASVAALHRGCLPAVPTHHLRPEPVERRAGEAVPGAGAGAGCAPGGRRRCLTAPVAAPLPSGANARLRPGWRRRSCRALTVGETLGQNRGRK